MKQLDKTTKGKTLKQRVEEQEKRVASRRAVHEAVAKHKASQEEARRRANQDDADREAAKQKADQTAATRKVKADAKAAKQKEDENKPSDEDAFKAITEDLGQDLNSEEHSSDDEIPKKGKVRGASSNKPSQKIKPTTSKQAATKQQQTSGANASNPDKNAATAVSKSAANQKTQTPVAAPTPTGPMGPPPSRRRPPPPQQSKCPPKDPEAGREKPRADSDLLPATTSTAPAHHQTRSKSATPARTLNRPSKYRKTPAPESAKSQTDPASEPDDFVPCGKNWGMGTREGEMPNGPDNECPLKKKNREKREQKRKADEAAKRTASTAGIDSPSGQPAKRRKGQGPDVNTQVDQDVQANDSPERLLSVIAETIERHTDEEGDTHDDDRILDLEDVDDEIVVSEDEDSAGPRRREYTAFIVTDLANREGETVAYRDLMEKLARGLQGDEVHEEDFRWAVDVLVFERAVQSEVQAGAEREEEMLWIGMDLEATGGSPAAEVDGGDEDDEDDGDDVHDEDSKRRKDEIDSGDEDSSNDPNDDDPNDDAPNDDAPNDDDDYDSDASETVWSANEPKDRRRRQALKALIMNALKFRDGNNAKSGEVLLDLRTLLGEMLKLDKGRGAEVVQEKEFESAIDKLVKEDQVRSEGRGRLRRLFLVLVADESDDAAEPEPWKSLPGFRPSDFLPSSGDDNSGDGSKDDDNHETNRRESDSDGKLRRKGLANAVWHDLSRFGSSVTYADFLARLTRIYEGKKVIMAEDFRRVIQRLVKKGHVLESESGLGVRRNLRIGTTPTGGSASASSDDDEEDDDQHSDSDGKEDSGDDDDNDGDDNGDGDVAKKSGKKGSPEDGLEAQSPGQAHIFKKKGRVMKSGNGRQPSKMIVDERKEPETSWVGPVVGGEEEPSGSNEVQDDAEEEQHQREQRQAKTSRGREQRIARAKLGQQHQQQPEADASPSKATRKRKAKTEDQALVEEGSFPLALTRTTRRARC